MAFKMNRPIIKGTPLHQKKKSLVTQTRTKADTNLVKSAEFLGKSTVPGQINFTDLTKDGININISENEDKVKIGDIAGGVVDKIHDIGDGLKKVGKFFRDPNGKIIDALGNVVGATVGIGGKIFDHLGNVVGNIQESIEETKQRAAEKKKLKEEEKKKKLKEEEERKKKEKEKKEYEELMKRYKEAEEGGPTEEEILDEQMKEDMAPGGVFYQEPDDYNEEEVMNNLNAEFEKFKEGENKKLMDEAIAQGEASNKAAQELSQKRINAAKTEYRTTADNLELRVVDGVPGYYPKDGTIGGPFETEFDITKGRYKIPSSGGSPTVDAQAVIDAMPPGRERMLYQNAADDMQEEALRQLQEAQPKLGEVDPEHTSTRYWENDYIRLNPDTNTLEYTENWRRVQELMKQDDPTKNLTENNTEENNENVTVTSNNLVKPKISDFKDKKNPFGGIESAKSQYQKALKEYYKQLEEQEKEQNIAQNPTPARNKSVFTAKDDRIFEFATPGGTIQKKMMKHGYIPKKFR
tara:strand:- start:60 stop:1625 length:1566 start_codon:yes stop_codon:yes gene_type:complete